MDEKLSEEQNETAHTKWPAALLRWFTVHRRDLPWRQECPRDPYKVWVAEIMLQQTKVEAVRPYYESWMEHFPDLPALAAASEDDVLRQWQGLGYYARARNLHEAVKEVAAVYGGKVPDKKEQMLALKGVGEYTAGAVLSIAYGLPEAAVDGNVLRVFSRLYNIEGNILSAPVKKQIAELVRSQLPEGRAGAFNEALMDFGAMVCIPRNPRCSECPLSSYCLAKKAGREKELPVRLTKKQVPAEDITVVVVEQEEKWLIHRRPGQGLLASMWEFPNAGGAGREGRRAVRRVAADVGLEIFVNKAPIGKLKHVFSHKIWNMTIYEGQVVRGKLMEKEDWQWLPRREYTAVPWAGPHGKITAIAR